MPDSGLQAKLSEQWDAVKGAPVPYLSALIIIVGLAFGGFQWVYGRILDQKEAQISTLKGRVEALTAEREELKGKFGQSNSLQSAPEHDPDRIYQFGDEVARVSGVEVDRSQSVVTFKSIVGSGNFDINQVMQLRRFYIGLCSFGAWGSQAQMGVVTVTSYAQVKCKILSARPN